jgi:hypothetical protein
MHTLMTVVLVLTGAFGVWRPEPPKPGDEQVAVATWYGSRSHRICVDGRERTCSPYVPRVRLGVELETKWYAATGSFMVYHTPAYWAEVCGDRGCVRVQVRDECSGCRVAAKDGKIKIDLSPWAFKEACGPLGRGICRVTIRHYIDDLPAPREYRSEYRRGDRWVK